MLFLIFIFLISDEENLVLRFFYYE